MARFRLALACALFVAVAFAPPLAAQRRGKQKKATTAKVKRASRQASQTRSMRRTRRARTRAVGRQVRRSPRAQRSEALHPMVTRQKQRSTLQKILDRVSSVAQSGKRPVVQIDLDLTALRPVERTIEALKTIGEREQIPELQNAESLPELPGYTVEAFAHWKESTGLGEKYTALSKYTSLDRPEFWNDSMLATDQAAPGLADFVKRVREAGGEVVFNSGRWRESMFEPSREALRKAGLGDAELFIGNSGYSDAGVKEARQKEIRERFGETVAVIDDRAANRDAVIRGAGTGALGIAIATPGFSADKATATQADVISTFEL